MRIELNTKYERNFLKGKTLEVFACGENNKINGNRLLERTEAPYIVIFITEDGKLSYAGVGSGD